MTDKLVRTPVAGYSGKVGAVMFVDGVARVDEDAQEMHYFRSAGYGVEDVDGDQAAAEEVEGLPRKSASTEAWRAFAVDNGMSQEQASALSRDDLVAHFTQDDDQEVGK
jgi:hypothetical protein